MKEEEVVRLDVNSLNKFIQSRWSHRPLLNSYRLIGKMLEVKFEDGFGEVIEIEKYYDWISKKRDGKLEQLLK
jgi:hypothetical protein